MAVFKHLLAAVDGSPASLHALKESFRFVGSEIAVISVAPPPRPGLGPETDQSLDSYLRDAGHQALAAAVELARAAGVSLKTLFAQGDPHDRIVAAAGSENCDLIVVGLKGQDLPAAALMGSTTARVIGFSPIDVLVVPEQAGVGFAKILLATDGSRFSRRATERALAICKAYGSELRVISVLDVPPGFMQEVPEVAGDLLKDVEGLVTEVQHRAETEGIRCQTAVGQGSAYRVITEAARKGEGSLIVMGSHGRTGVRRLLMGSVTERVVGTSPCPVLVVKGDG